MAGEEKKKRGRGRPRKGEEKVDPFRQDRAGRPDALVPDERTLKQMHSFGASGLSYERMAAFLGVSLTALSNFRKKWPEVDMTIDQGRAQIDHRIALTQIDKALKDRDTKMLIHLGEQRLGQSKKIDTKTTGEIAINIDKDDAEM